MSRWRSSALFSQEPRARYDRPLLSGIIFVARNELRWRDAPREYGPAKTLYNRWKRWSEEGIFIRMVEGLAMPQAPDRKTFMIDATYLKAHRTASSLRLKMGGRTPDRPDERRYEHKGSPELVERPHAVTDANGRPISFFLTAGQVSDYTGAAGLLDSLPKAQRMLANRGYGSATRCRRRVSRPASRAENPGQDRQATSCRR